MSSSTKADMTKDYPTIYIIIPVHNRLAATGECLESLRCQTYQHFKIVVIDDGSTDGTWDYIGENYPDVVTLKGDGNLWWTGATNLGVHYALQYCQEDDYILTLNNDTVLPSAYLNTLISLSKMAPKALIGSIARDYGRQGVSVDEGVRIHWFSAKFKKIGNKKESFYTVSALPGRGTLIPTRVFHRIGLYDAKKFPHYAADYDFSLRASRAGYALVLHPDCYLYSKTNLTGISNVHNDITYTAWLKSFHSIKSPNNLRTRLRFGVRHAPFFCRPSFIICDFLRVILGTLRNQVKN